METWCFDQNRVPKADWKVEEELIHQARSLTEKRHGEGEQTQKGKQGRRQDNLRLTELNLYLFYIFEYILVDFCVICTVAHGNSTIFKPHFHNLHTSASEYPLWVHHSRSLQPDFVHSGFSGEKSTLLETAAQKHISRTDLKSCFTRALKEKFAECTGREYGLLFETNKNSFCSCEVLNSLLH